MGPRKQRHVIAQGLFLSLSFLPPTVVGGRCPIPLKIELKVTHPPLSNTTISTEIRSLVLYNYIYASFHGDTGV